MNAENDSAAALAPPPGVAPPAPVDAPAKILCANCGAELFGPHCYSCGQPVKGMVRQLSSILADVFDTVLNIDSRIFRTLGPLVAKPGYLTNEYLAGRRVRYVTPFRLYFFLSVVAFLIISVSIDANFDLQDTVRIDTSDAQLSSAQDEAQVKTRRDAALAAMEQAKLAPNLSEHALRGIDKAEEHIHQEAEKRLEYLARVTEAKAQGRPPPPEPKSARDRKDDEDFNFEVDGKNWNPKKTPIAIGWLPAFVNAKINVLATHFVDNLPRIKKDPKPFLIGAFSNLPQVLFVLMPLFALLLKIFYIFKRRLYMEHVIVALHSHSFIFATLLLITLAGLLKAAVGGNESWFGRLLGWIMFALGWWLPIYLLIMQKRVYKQGWFLTVLKYCAIGLCYTVLVSTGVGVAFVISLATT